MLSRFVAILLVFSPAYCSLIPAVTDPGDRILQSTTCNQYLYPNGSCLPTCAAPYAVGEYQSMMTCENLCHLSKYLYPDGSCQYSCPVGYQVKFETTVSGEYSLYCYFPCDSNQYLYQDNSCSATCRAGFEEQIDSYNNKFCNYPCYYTGGALYDNGTCSNCPTPFIYRESWFGFCRFSCASNQYYSNGRCTASCEAGSTPRIDGSFRFCDSNTTNNRTDQPCSSPNLFKYQNGSCLSTCPFPLLLTWQGYYPSHAYCTYPCSPGNYLYPNTSCLPECQSGFVPRVDGNMSFCDYNLPNPPITDSTTCFIYSVEGVMTTNCPNANNTCPPDSFQYQNGSCLPTCRDPYYSILRNGSAYCSSPCASNEFLYPDGTCSATCVQGMNISDNNFGFCDTNDYNGTCIQGFFKYDNGSCLPICHFPLSTTWENDNAFCRSPCSPGALLFPNGTCAWTCDMYWHVVVEGSIQYCKPPCPDDQFILYDTCISTCDQPRKHVILYGLNYCNDVPLSDCEIYNATWYGDGFYQTYCYNPYNDCDSYNFEYEDGSCMGACRYPMIPEIRNMSAFCVKDPNYTGPDNTSCWPWEYAYPNGSCLSHCSPPFLLSYNYQNYSYSCAIPCSPDMYTYDNGNCSSTCDSRFINIEAEDYKYCKRPCGSDSYLLPNGTCTYYCPFAIHEIFNGLPICNPDNQTQTSCGTFEYDGGIGTNCSNPDTVCGPEQFQYENYTCCYSCVYPYVPLIVNSSAYCVVNSTNTNPNNQTNSTDPYYCEIYSSMDFSTTNCTNPYNNCGQDQFQYADGHCDYYCYQPSYYPYVSNFSAYCAVNTTNNQTNNTGTVSLQLYIRYNMSLIDFNSQDGLNRFIQQLALILGVDPSDIVIIDVREGSTIIETQVILTSESDQNSITTGTNKAQEMMKNYSSAIDNQQFNIFAGVDILDSRQSVQVSTPSTGSISQALSSESSSGSAVGIGAGVGLAVLFVVAGGYWFYRRYRARKDVKSVKTGADVVRENAKQNDQEANNTSSVTIKKMDDIEPKHQISTPQGLEFDQKDSSFEQHMKDFKKIDREDEQDTNQELSAVLNLDNIGINIES